MLVGWNIRSWNIRSLLSTHPLKIEHRCMKRPRRVGSLPKCDMTQSYTWHGPFHWLLDLASDGSPRNENALQQKAKKSGQLTCDMIHLMGFSSGVRCPSEKGLWRNENVLRRMKGMSMSCNVANALYVWHDSFIYATWLTRMCDVTHTIEGHDALHTRLDLRA